MLAILGWLVVMGIGLFFLFMFLFALWFGNAMGGSQDKLELVVVLVIACIMLYAGITHAPFTFVLK